MRSVPIRKICSQGVISAVLERSSPDTGAPPGGINDLTMPWLTNTYPHINYLATSYLL